MNENNSNENVNNEVENKVEYVPKSKKSKKRDDGIYVQYRKPSFFSTILLVLIGILIGIVIMLLVYVVKTHKDLELYKEDVPVVEQPQEEQQPEVDEPVVEEKELDLSIEGEFVKKLYNKYISHKSQITTGHHLSDEDRLNFTINQLEVESKYQVITDLTYLKTVIEDINSRTYLKEVNKIEFETVKERYKEIFGADKEVPMIEAYTTSCTVYKYVSQDNCYYGYKVADPPNRYYSSCTKIYNCEKNIDGTEIYIYDGFIACNHKYDGSILYNTSDYTDKMIIDNIDVAYDEAEQIMKYNGMTLYELLEKYWENSGKFKHTFKLDSAGNYYWYSSEQI